MEEGDIYDSAPREPARRAWLQFIPSAPVESSYNYSSNYRQGGEFALSVIYPLLLFSHFVASTPNPLLIKGKLLSVFLFSLCVFGKQSEVRAA